MATIKAQTDISFRITLELSEDEARALKAITTYSASDFLRVYSQHLGGSAIESQGAGLRSLFATVNNSLPQELAKVDAARKQLKSLT